MQDTIGDLIKREGGFVNHASDKGGATKYGITQTTLSSWRGKSVTENDVAALCDAEARDIYYNKFITGPNFDKIPDMKLREMVIDAGVNSGPSRATKWIQEILGIQADGIMGVMTLTALRNMNPAQRHELRKAYTAKRMIYIASLVTADPSQIKFLRGWTSRVMDLMREYV